MLGVSRSVHTRSSVHPVRLLSGDALPGLDAELRKADISRPLIVTGPTLGSNPRSINPVLRSLGGRQSVIFAGVKPDCPQSVVEEVSAAARDGRCDGVIAYGGGSSIVTARAACMQPRVAERMDIDLALLGIPHIAVPTTPTTAMARSGAAVHLSGKRRVELFDPMAAPVAVLLHGELLQATPESVFIDTAAATFSNAAELLTTPNLPPLVHADLREAVDVSCQALTAWAAGDRGTEIRLLLAIAAFLCGRASSSMLAKQSTIGLALGHCIQRLGSIRHGAAMTSALITGLIVNAEQTSVGQQELLGLLQGHRDAPDLPAAIAAMIRPLELPLHPEEAGYAADDIIPLLPAAKQSYFARSNVRGFESEEGFTDAVLQALQESREKLKIHIGVRREPSMHAEGLKMERGTS